MNDRRNKVTAQTLLIVDDSRLSRMMVRAFTQANQPDWHIIEACNGEEALSVCEGQEITYMTIDYNMPGIDGLHLALQLRDIYPNAKISLLTANIQQHLMDEAKASGLAFISKPITEQKIASFITAQ